MEDGNKKKISSYLVTLIAGLLLGFFGVFVSVFSDGSDYERMITILVVLIVYGVLGIIIGIWKPLKTFIYLPYLCLPGVFLLIFYMYKEFNVLYIVFLILILAISYFGLKTGRSFKKPKNK